jgi:hypothetical protein
MSEEKKVKEELPYWDIVYEQQVWDEYLAWCEKQEIRLKESTLTNNSV